MKKCRLSIVATSAFDSSQEAEVFYMNFKACLKDFTELQVHGTIIQTLDSCCPEVEKPK